jgi:hypothetical protein
LTYLIHLIALLSLFISAGVNADRDRDWIFLVDDRNGTPLYYSLEGSGEKFVSGGLLGLVFDKPRIWSRILERVVGKVLIGLLECGSS